MLCSSVGALRFRPRTLARAELLKRPINRTLSSSIILRHPRNSPLRVRTGNNAVPISREVVRETQQDLVLHQSNSEDSQEETTDDNSTVDEAIADNDADAAVEDRFQIGRRSLGTIDLPDELKRSIARIIQRQDASRLREDSLRLAHHLFTRSSRQRAIAGDLVMARDKETRIRLVEELMESHAMSKSQAQKIVMAEHTRRELEALSESTSNQKAAAKPNKETVLPHTMRYGMREALAYLTSRSPGVYAAMYRALMEIVDLDEAWKPTSLFDFGTGTGMTLWAVNELWYTPMERVLCVELSEAMQELTQALLVDPHTDALIQHLDNVEYKRHMPVNAEGSQDQYDLVTSGFSLCELEDAEARMSHVRQLWARTSHYLVLVEPGNHEGFQNILEARALLLEDPDAQLVAPCPHNAKCPAADTEDPCHLGQRVGYTPEQASVLSSKKVKKHNYKSQTFSFVIFARSSQKDITTALGHETLKWDRLVQPPLKRKGHVICDVCTKQGCLERYTIGRAYGRNTFRDVRKRYWGDLLPPYGYFEDQYRS